MNYKPFLALPIGLLVLSLAFLAYGYSQTGEWFLRSADLKGGTMITLKGAQGNFSLSQFKASVQDIGGFTGQGVLIEVPTDVDPKDVLASLESQGISTKDASVQTVGSSLGETFWAQAQIGLVLAFIMMSLVVFFLFRKLIPCIAVIFAAFADIMVTLAIMQFLQIPLSLPGLAAILMLVGYSVDTDILLTSRVLRGSGEMISRFWGAFWTGLTMTLTAIGVMVVLILTNISVVITQIATVLLIGLILDIFNTWINNAGILRWYVEKKGVMNV